MTSSEKIEANRRNALRSTGPRTRLGKLRSARNSKKHGMTSRANSTEALEIFRDILGDDTADPKYALDDKRTSCALRLAIAEAQLNSVRQSEYEYFKKNIDDLKNSFNNGHNYDGFNQSQALRASKMKPKVKQILKLTDLNTKSNAQAAASSVHLVHRYIREAEAAHTKALNKWCTGDNLNFRNKAK